MAEGRFPPYQKGPKTVATLGSSDPVRKQDNAFQAETKTPYSYKLSKDPNMPTVTLETNRAGKIGSLDLEKTNKPLRQAFTKEWSNPYQNLGTRWVRPNEFESTPGAFNK